MTRKAVALITGALILGMLGTVGPVGASVSPGHRVATRDAAPLDHIKVRPVEGPNGTELWVRGYVAPGTCYFNRKITIRFLDAGHNMTVLGSTDGGQIDFVSYVPGGAALGAGLVQAVKLRFFFPRRCAPLLGAQAPFDVTEGPGIFGFFPRSGPVGTTVTIYGVRLMGAKSVTFGGTPADFTVDSDSQITATVPAGAGTGPIKIHTHPGKAVSGPNFVVT